MNLAQTTQVKKWQKAARWTRRHSRGYTIIEVAIAMMVIGLGLTSATVCLRYGMLLQDSARATTYATQVLQDEAESLRLLNWGGIKELPKIAILTPLSTLAPESMRPERFTFKRHITEVEDKPDLKNIHLLAQWKGISQKTYNLKIEFLYAKNGMHDYLYGVRP
jgi:prepilin-type N-terminal cleavage/methylation domain-containing protein